ncbi:hypothetical protein KR026_007933 [Drosophila bipectinata]|nr:hypothetical protein KR026_007933 [Drosophila bipectinata]
MSKGRFERHYKINAHKSANFVHHLVSVSHKDGQIQLPHTTPRCMSTLLDKIIIPVDLIGVGLDRLRGIGRVCLPGGGLVRRPGGGLVGLPGVGLVRRPGGGLVRLPCVGHPDSPAPRKYLWPEESQQKNPGLTAASAAAPGSRCHFQGAIARRRRVRILIRGQRCHHQPANHANVNHTNAEQANANQASAANLK